MKNKLYKAIHDLYFSLNPYLFQDLKSYCLLMSDNLYTLEKLIQAFSVLEITENIFEYIEELKNNNSIGCMAEYYELINFMIEEATT